MSDLSSSLEIPRIYAQDQASLGWWTAEDQELFYKQRVAILGTGGAGGGVAESLVRAGMQVTLADPDVFGETNLNRQNGSYRDTLGVNKAEAIAEQLQRVRPQAARVFTEGITPENMDEVLKDATIVLDAIDIAHGALSIMVARRARKLGLPVFMGIEIGYGCSVTCFDPNETEMTAEHYYGVSNDQEITAETDISLSQIIVHMPTYTPKGMFEAFTAGDELEGTPGVSAGVLLLGSVMATKIKRWVLGHQQSYPNFVYPNMYVLDPIDGMKVIHASERAEHLAESFQAIGTNPQSSGYSPKGSYEIRKP